MEYAIKEIARVIGAKTNQLLDDTVSLLLTDSRRLSFPEKSLFFALKTKTNDGHRYIQELYKLRVRNFVVSDMLPEFESMKDANFLIVKDTLRALQKLATHHRKQFNIPVIGITGSNGKTIVKEFLYQLLHNEFNIVRSPRSYNSQLGVPLSVWQMSEKNTLGIFEAGISQPDEMERLQPIIAPTIGIITNIGEAHQENFLSSNQKCMEKLTLFNDCEAIIYDGDDLFIANCIESACLSHKAIAWSRTDSEAPLFIESIDKKEFETIIHCTLLGFNRVVTIPFTDDASIENVIHCKKPRFSVPVVMLLILGSRYPFETGIPMGAFLKPILLMSTQCCLKMLLPPPCRFSQRQSGWSGPVSLCLVDPVRPGSASPDGHPARTLLPWLSGY